MATLVSETLPERKFSLRRLLSWRRAQPSTEEELESLTKTISKITAELLHKQHLERKVVRRLLLFSAFGYCVLAIFIYFFMLAHHDDDNNGQTTKPKSGKHAPHVSRKPAEPYALWVLKLALITLSPAFFMYCIIRLLQWLFRWQVARSQARLAESTKRKQYLLERVRDTEPYNSACRILARFGSDKNFSLASPARGAKLLSTTDKPVNSDIVKKPAGKEDASSVGTRRRTIAALKAEPNSSSGGNEPEASSSFYRPDRAAPGRCSAAAGVTQPANLHTKPAVLPTSSSLFGLFSRAASAAETATENVRPASPKLKLPVVPAVVPQYVPPTVPKVAPKSVTPYVPAAVLSKAPPFFKQPLRSSNNNNKPPQQPSSILDRAVSWLVGEGPDHRFALICNHCYGHNGMALPEEFEYMGFKCCYCDGVNYPRKQRLMEPPPVAPNQSTRSATSLGGVSLVQPWRATLQPPTNIADPRLSSGRQAFSSSNTSAKPNNIAPGGASERVLLPFAEVAETNDKIQERNAVLKDLVEKSDSVSCSSDSSVENIKDGNGILERGLLHTDSQPGVVSAVDNGSETVYASAFSNATTKRPAEDVGVSDMLSEDDDSEV